MALVTKHTNCAAQMGYRVVSEVEKTRQISAQVWARQQKPPTANNKPPTLSKAVSNLIVTQTLNNTV